MALYKSVPQTHLELLFNFLLPLEIILNLLCQKVRQPLLNMV